MDCVKNASKKAKNIKVDLISKTSLFEKVHSAFALKKPLQIVTLNAIMLNEAFANISLANVINSSGAVVADSSGIVFASRFLCNSTAQKNSGIDLVDSLCQYAQQNALKVFLFGAKPTVADLAAINLKLKYPSLEICGISHGYFKEKDNKEIVAQIKNSNVNILIVALQTPYQELWLSENLRLTGALVGIGVGGSFDVISGKLKRAPVFFRKYSLEWVYRFYLEPLRATRLLKLFQFVFRVVIIWLGGCFEKKCSVS